MPEIAPTPQIFVNEDLSKYENRLNLALFNVLAIPVIRKWFLTTLSFPIDCIVYPPENAGIIRPDFVVVDQDRTVVGWIEVEIGAQDTAQLKTYRQSLIEPIKSIVGLDNNSGDLSLETIAREINETLTDGLDPQQAIGVELLTRLIVSLRREQKSWEYIDPLDLVRNVPILKNLQEHLGEMLRYGTPPVLPGIALVSTITQRGWTLRVFSKSASMGSVSVLWAQALGINQVRVPSYARMARCLPASIETVDAYANLLTEIGRNIRALSEKQSLPVEESSLMTKISSVAAIIKTFANAYGSHRVF